MSEFVLDASALLALVRAEPGAKRVRAVLARAVISAVNLAEVVGRLAEHGGHAGEIRRGLGRLRLTVVPVDEELGYAAACFGRRPALLVCPWATGSAWRWPRASAPQRSPATARGSKSRPTYA